MKTLCINFSIFPVIFEMLGTFLFSKSKTVLIEIKFIQLNHINIMFIYLFHNSTIKNLLLIQLERTRVLSTTLQHAVEVNAAKK